LPSAFSVNAPTTLVLNDELRISNEGILVNVLTVSATESDNAFVGRYECQFKKSTDSTFIDIGIGTQPSFEIVGVQQGIIYDVRLRAISSIGVKSSFLSGQHSVIGELSPPSDVQNFAVNIVGQDAHLSWDPVGDKDLSEYVIHYSALTTGASWQNSVPLVQKVSRPATSITVPALVGSYLCKSRDKSGNYSSNEAIISTNISAIGNFNAVATQTENPGFTGTKTNVARVDNTLVLDTVELFDDNTTDNFDSITSHNFDGGTKNNNIQSSGTYEFSDVIDLGGIFTSRVVASISQTATDRDRLFDNVGTSTANPTGFIDTEPGNFDGDAPQESDSHIEVSTSDDNITFTSFRKFAVGDYTSRFYKFRLIMTSQNNSATPIVSALSVQVDMPDKIISFNDKVSGTGIFTVSFSNNFKNTSYAIGISAQGLASGDFYEITNKQVGSFDIAFKNSSNTGISRTFDAICKGI